MIHESSSIAQIKSKTGRPLWISFRLSIARFVAFWEKISCSVPIKISSYAYLVRRLWKIGGVKRNPFSWENAQSVQWNINQILFYFITNVMILNWAVLTTKIYCYSKSSQSHAFCYLLVCKLFKALSFYMRLYGINK